MPDLGDRQAIAARQSRRVRANCPANPAPSPVRSPDRGLCQNPNRPPLLGDPTSFDVIRESSLPHAGGDSDRRKEHREQMIQGEGNSLARGERREKFRIPPRRGRRASPEPLTFLPFRGGPRPPSSTPSSG